MDESNDGPRVAAAAGMLMFHGAALAAGGRGLAGVVAVALAWSLLRGHRATRALVFGAGALIGAAGAAGLARYWLHVAGWLAPARAPASPVWVAWFACVFAFCLALAALLAPRSSPASPCP